MKSASASPRIAVVLLVLALSGRETTTAQGVCGDGTVDAGEQCDDGNTTPGDGCDANCQNEALCGNGTVDTGEQCDDGNTTPGDGCDANCQNEAQEAAENEFLGFQWGLGVGVSVDLGGDEPVESANVVGGVVRVEQEVSERPRILLEVHNFIFHNGCTQEKRRRQVERFNAARVAFAAAGGGTQIPNRPCELEKATSGHGPFVAIQSSAENAVDGFALGYMIGWRKSTAPEQTSSFNLGGGLIIDGSVKVLGDGIKADQPLPEGETSIRFKEESRLGLLLFASFTF